MSKWTLRSAALITTVILISCGSDKSSSPTSDTTAPGTIADLTVLSVTENSVTLQWTAPGDDDNTGTATKYDIRHNPITIHSGNWASATVVATPPTPKVAGSTETFVVTVPVSLTASSADVETFFFAIRAADEVDNMSGVSNVVSQTFGDDVAPAAITDLTVTATTDSSVFLQWTAPGDDSTDGTASTYDIRFSNNTITEGNWENTPLVTGEPAPQTAGTQQSMEVFIASGLTSPITRFFAIRTADDGNNLSGISNVVSAVIGDNTPPNKVVNLSIASTTDTSVFLTWSAPGDDGSSGTAISYDLRYANATINESNWDAATQVDGEPAPQLSGSNESMEVVVGASIAAQIAAGVDAAETWFFAIRATDDAQNESEISNVVNAAVGDDTSPNAISNLSLGSVTDTSVMLTWTAPGDDGITGQAESYDVRYASSNITDQTWGDAISIDGEPAPAPSGTTESIMVVLNTTTVARLSAATEADTTWYFAIRSTDNAGNESALSNVVSTQLADNTSPAAVSDFAITTVTDSSVTVTWTATGDDGETGTASSFDIRYSASELTEGSWSGATQVQNEPSPLEAGSSQSLEIVIRDGLSLASSAAADESYWFGMRVIDDRGNESPLSNVVNQTLPDIVAPKLITDVEVTMTTASTISISWTAPGDDWDEGTADSYEIRYSTSEITDENWDSATLIPNPPTPQAAGQQESLTISGLTNATKYWIRIRTKDESENWSPLSIEVSAVAIDDVVVNFSEQAIEDVVRNRLNKPTGNITSVDMLSLTSVSVRNEGLTSLSGLEHALNLNNLSVFGNNISDLTPIGNLKNLTFLDISDNSVTDIGPLAGATALETLLAQVNSITSISVISGLTSLINLSVWGNQISDLSPLAGHPALEQLTISSNSISDLSPLSGVTTLQELNCHSNSITTLSPLSGLTSLTSLYAASNQITDLTPLSGLTKLEELYVADNGITSLAGLSGLPLLNDISAWGNSITDLSPISNLPSLKILWLYNNNISDISSLSANTGIEQLSLFGNSISNLSALSGMTNLRRLFLSNNSISDLSPLTNLTALEEVQLDGNQITNLSPLSGRQALWQLTLGNNTISDISPLAGLTALTELSLWGNSLTDISTVAGLSTLQELRLNDNPLVDISPVSGLSALSSLDIGSTQVVDLSPVVNNADFATGDWLFIFNLNTLSDESVNTHIPALQARGVTVVE